MTVKKYYYEHFNDLTPEKQFHFATRIKNYFKVHDFDDFLHSNIPDQNLEEILSNNDYSKVNNYDLRRPVFERYPNLYGVEATLFRIHHLLVEYNIDTREQFKKLYSIEKLHQLSDRLQNDDEALRVLSTWAVNTIYLTEELFPKDENVIKELSEWTTNQDPDNFEPTLFVYLCTHIIICESEFYTKNLNNSVNLPLSKLLLGITAKTIEANIDTISLDAAIEFLVCCNLVNVEYKELKNQINKICDEYRMDSPFLINYRRDTTPGSYFHTLNGAEHINVLYIMSGLDH